jgi:hypothetical protein
VQWNDERGQSRTRLTKPVLDWIDVAILDVAAEILVPSEGGVAGPTDWL